MHERIGLGSKHTVVTHDGMCTPLSKLFGAFHFYYDEHVNMFTYFLIQNSFFRSLLCTQLSGIYLLHQKYFYLKEHSKNFLF